MEAAEIFGVPTGGQSRRGTTSPGEARRFGLAVDCCSRRQALQTNARRAQGTLVFGKPSRLMLRQLEQCGRVFEIQTVLKQTVKWISDWIERFDVRTLNIVGCDWSVDADACDRSKHAGQVIIDLLARQGRKPLLPVNSNCGVIAGRDGIYAVRLWRTPRGWLWNGGMTGWKPVRRDGWIVELKFTCGDQWYRPLLPRQILLAMSPEGEHLDCTMLTLLSRLGQTALDLARAGRWAVLRMLASPSKFVDCGVSRHVIRQLAKVRQRDLIGAFGFPATESAVRTLAKVSQTVPVEMLLQLRDMLRDPDTTALLRQVPGINRVTVEVLADAVFRRWITPSFLVELNNRGVLDDTLELSSFHDRMRDLGVEPRAGSIRSIGDMFDLYRGCCSVPAAPVGPPPPAPVPLSGVIMPLKADQLVVEGYQMRHCVQRYRDEVEAGLCLIFRILPDPELGTGRATLMLRPGPSSDRWQVAQLAGKENQPVSCATQRLVEIWLEHVGTEPAISVKELRDRRITETGIIAAELAA